MSKRNKARRDEIIRSMEGLALLKAPESKGAIRATPKSGKRSVKFAVGLMVVIIFSAAGLWLLRY